MAPELNSAWKEMHSIARDAHDDTEGEGAVSKHIEIDPYQEGRSPYSNYRLLISAIVPRPIGLLSTRSKDGSTTNLAPFSYFQMFNHDPPMFMFGFATSLSNPRDSLRNLVETGEGVVNTVSEHILERVNATSVNAPYGISEFALAGLTPASSTLVKSPRVEESLFSVECKLVEVKEYHSKMDVSQVTSTMVILEGVRFWAREDAINSDGSKLDIEVGTLF
ncbi:hypothetical protein ACHAPJ_012489 [Fusarium lateritium]